MPAQLEDPASPKIHRRSGKPPYPNDSTSLLQNIHPTQFTLRDGTTATLLPFTSHKQLPAPLLAFICDLLNLEIERGDSYPMLDPFPYDQFGQYWFGVFGTAMIRGSIPEVKGIMERAMTAEDAGSASPNLWGELCLGSFYVKPNYPGRSSHCCNAGFVVSDAAKGAGVGRAMGEAYVDWAAKLVGVRLSSALGSCGIIHGEADAGPGLYVLGVQPRLRDKRRFLQDLGRAGFPDDRAGAGMR